MTGTRSARGGRPVVRVEPVGAEIEVADGETIIEAAWRLGYRWPTVCYGQAECTACHVEVLGGAENLAPVEDEEQDALDHRLSGASRRDMTRIRLACRAKPTGDVVVRKNGVRLEAGVAARGKDVTEGAETPDAARTDHRIDGK